MRSTFISRGIALLVAVGFGVAADAGHAAVRQLSDVWPGWSEFSPGLDLAQPLPDGRLFAFVEVDQAVGEEPYAIAPNGEMRLLADTCPGPCSPNGNGYSDVVGSRVLFRVSIDGTFTTWLTDGTASHTQPLPDYVAGSSCSSFLGETPGALVFVKFETATGCEPWAWDLANRSWRLLVDANPGEGSSNTWPVGPVANGVLVTLTTGTAQYALWTLGSDAASSFEVARVTASNQPFYTPAYAAVGTGPWVLSGPGTPVTTRALWVSDGTVAGTRRIVDDAAFAQPSPVASVGSFVLATATIAGKSQLIRVDVASGAIVQLTHFGSVGGLYFAYRTSTSVGPKAFAFLASDGVHGTELWWTDGTVAGTRMARDLCKGACSSNPEGLVSTGQRLVFTVTTPAKGREVWTALPLKAPTLVLDSCPGPCSKEPETELGAPGFAVFRTDDAINGRNFWITDGTRPGTQRLGNSQDATIIPTSTGAFVEAPVEGEGNHLLHFTNPRSVLTEIVLEPVRGEPNSSSPSGLAPSGGGVYFTAFDGAHGREMWHFDGATARRVGEVAYGHAGISNVGVAAVQGGVVFSHTKVYFAPGPQGPLRRLPSACAPRSFLVRGARAFFECNRELYATDGTEAGTVHIGIPDSDSSSNTYVEPWSTSQVAFIGERTRNSGYGLFVSDGTIAGTHELPGPIGSLDDLVVSNRIFAVRGNYPSDLVVSDGNPTSTAATIPFPTDVRPESSFAHPRGYGAFAENGEIWSSDGTPAGWIRHGRWRAENASDSPPDVHVLPQGLLVERNFYPEFPPLAWLDPGSGELRTLNYQGRVLGDIQVVAGQAYFLASGLDQVKRLYRTNGTATNAKLLVTGDVSDFAVSPDGTKVYLSLEDPEIGRELFVWEE